MTIVSFPSNLHPRSLYEFSLRNGIRDEGRDATDTHFTDLKHRVETEDMAPSEYPGLIGSLLWVARCTGPDAAFVVNKLLQFLKEPSTTHWDAALRVLRYLNTTKHLHLRLGGDLTCAGYSDADWGEDKQDRRSTSAYTFQIGKGSVSWRSKK